MAAPATRVRAQTAAPEVAAPTITVVGAVNQPGKFSVVPGETVVALLARAGGANAVAAIAKIYVLRQGVSIPLDLSQPLASKFVLRAGDVLVVPEALRRIFVVGAVARPGTFALPEGKETSVLDAITWAGGPLSSPMNMRIGILRGKTNVSIEWHLWPKKAGDDVLRLPLQDGEGIYVQRIGPRAPSNWPEFIWPTIPQRPAVIKLLSY